jgi:hypothetical protein
VRVACVPSRIEPSCLCWRLPRTSHGRCGTSAWRCPESAVSRDQRRTCARGPSVTFHPAPGCRLARSGVIHPDGDPVRRLGRTGAADRLAGPLGVPHGGLRVPVVVVPHCKPQLASHPAFGAGLDTLRSMGVRVLFDPDAPYESRLPSWAEVTAAISRGGTCSRAAGLNAQPNNACRSTPAGKRRQARTDTPPRPARRSQDLSAMSAFLAIAGKT